MSQDCCHCLRVHRNGFSVDKMGRKYLWVARRSMTKQTFPGMLDHVVAGGQPVGLSCRKMLSKNAMKKLAFPWKLQRVSAVSYEDVDFVRLKRDVLFCYDLELPRISNHIIKVWIMRSLQNGLKTAIFALMLAFIVDGEVDSLNLLPISEVEKMLRESEAYKPNCALVVIDFLIRHGIIP
ncbi:hypothetical protein L7F22_067006 [Adiantum nelumboides]|nr:hypothetical protein [Adiantum nelumboides]